MREGGNDQTPLFGADAAKLGRQMVTESIAYDTAQVVDLLRATWSDSTIERWLATPNPRMGGSRPLDQLHANNTGAVTEAARLALTATDVVVRKADGTAQ